MTSNFVSSVYHENKEMPLCKDNIIPLKAINLNKQENLSQDTNNEEEWSWSTTIWNIIAIVLCPSFIGCMITALICNIMAYVDYKTGDLNAFRYKLKCSMWWSIGTFTLAIICIVIVIVILFGIQKAQDWTSLPFGVATEK